MNAARATAEKMVLEEFIYTLEGKKEKTKEIKPRFNSFDDLPAVLNANQLGAALNISRANAYCLMRSADFTTLQIGHRMLVRRERLLEWIKEQEKTKLA